MGKRVLLHSCCGPCASHCLFALREAGYSVMLCFSNANIAPAEEFEKRLEALKRLAEVTDTPYCVDPPDHADWLESVAKGFEREPERGARCARCFRYSLTRAAKLREAYGCDAFTTSLTVSPHKSSPTLFAVGKEVDGEHFLSIDFKKKDGFLDSLRRAAEYGLYRQDYCGCEFSLAARRQEAPHA